MAARQPQAAALADQLDGRRSRRLPVGAAL